MFSERGCSSLIITHNPSLQRLIWLWWLIPCGRVCAPSLSVRCGTGGIRSATLIAKSSGLFLCQRGGCVEGKSILSYTVFGNKPSQVLCSSLIAWCNGEWWVGLCVGDRMSVCLWGFYLCEDHFYLTKRENNFRMWGLFTSSKCSFGVYTTTFTLTYWGIHRSIPLSLHYHSIHPPIIKINWIIVLFIICQNGKMLFMRTQNDRNVLTIRSGPSGWAPLD